MTAWVRPGLSFGGADATLQGNEVDMGKLEPQLDNWLLSAKNSLVGSFARGIARDPDRHSSADSP
jgi:hypothetical protein